MKIFDITFTLSIAFSLLSETVMPKVNLWIGIIILVLFIGIGILFDMVGVAVTFALTIGGKTMGKGIAVNKSNIIPFEFSKILSFFYSSKK